MRTLADETKEAIAGSGHDVADILWIGGTGRDDAENMADGGAPNTTPMRDGGALIDASEFWDVAGRTVYDDGYGIPEVPLDVIIMFSDGSWLERREYDGAEWWAWRSVERPTRKMRITTLRDRSGIGSMYGVEKLQVMGRSQ